MGNRREHEKEDDDECFEKYFYFILLGIAVAVIFLVIFALICCRSCKKKRQRRAFRSKLLQWFSQIALFMKTLSQIRSDYTTARAHKGTPTVSNLWKSCQRAHLSTLALPTPTRSCRICTTCGGWKSYPSARISTSFPEQHTARLQPELQCLKQNFLNKIPEQQHLPDFRRNSFMFPLSVDSVTNERLMIDRPAR